MVDFEITVTTREGGIAELSWRRQVIDDGLLSAEGLERAISLTADDVLIGRGMRRLEISVPAADRTARRAVLRAGFRQEGIRRQVVPIDAETFDDLAVYGRLVADQTAGPAAFSGVMNSVLPRKRLIAHVLIRDDDDRILLCDTKFKPDWELPGGIVEPFEPPRLGAIREVAEELGVTRDLGPLLCVDWLPPYLGWDDAVELIFDGGRMEEAELPGLILQPTEIRLVAFCTLDQAGEVVTPLSHRRLSAITALAPGQVVLLEDGHPIPS